MYGVIDPGMPRSQDYTKYKEKSKSFETNLRYTQHFVSSELTNRSANRYYFYDMFSLIEVNNIWLIRSIKGEKFVLLNFSLFIYAIFNISLLWWTFSFATISPKEISPSFQIFMKNFKNGSKWSVNWSTAPVRYRKFQSEKKQINFVPLILRKHFLITKAW